MSRIGYIIYATLIVAVVTLINFSDHSSSGHGSSWGGGSSGGSWSSGGGGHK
ncbi:MAG: hypothetical protein L6Q69_08325 [Zoogloea sp.]|nr:hypothetical protein [Zoogloea sp.]